SWRSVPSYRRSLPSCPRCASGEGSRGRRRSSRPHRSAGRRSGRAARALLRPRAPASQFLLPDRMIAPLLADHADGFLVEVGAECFVQRDREAVHLDGPGRPVGAPAPDRLLAVLGDTGLIDEVGGDGAHQGPGLVEFKDYLHLVGTPVPLAPTLVYQRPARDRARQAAPKIVKSGGHPHSPGLAALKFARRDGWYCGPLRIRLGPPRLLSPPSTRAAATLRRTSA